MQHIMEEATETLHTNHVCESRLLNITMSGKPWKKRILEEEDSERHVGL